MHQNFTYTIMRRGGEPQPFGLQRTTTQRQPHKMSMEEEGDPFDHFD
jgi:hypothetical protein